MQCDAMRYMHDLDRKPCTHTHTHTHTPNDHPCARAQKSGLEATGILAGVSKAAGFGSVKDLLTKNPTAKRPDAAELALLQHLPYWVSAA